ncbi:MAG: hypothetical protein INQ03_23730 [Candidatus Heimdallarchaeota archaeon]|nr:hypothetical protein [Candidatus Heimdallarchaeota archaeon]
MATNRKIQLEFLNFTGISESDAKLVEDNGMVILASDFIKTGKVNKAEDLVRISKLNIPIYLSQTKSGKFIPVNPSSNNIISIPIVQLPSLQEITEFVSEPSNLNLDKLYKQMLKFRTEETELVGGFKDKDVKIIEEILKAPRGTRSDFPKLPISGDLEKLRSQLKIINSMVYDENSLEKEINDRFKIIETALTEESTEYSSKYEERKTFWKAEIDNASVNLEKRLKERDKQLEVELKELDQHTKKKIKDTISMFYQGVAKNIRKDEQPIEKLIQELEAVTTKPPVPEHVDSITKILEKMRDSTNTLLADIDFQMRKVRTVNAKEQEFLEDQGLDIKGLEAKAQREKEEMIEESRHLEENRDTELAGLKADRDAANTRLAEFKDKMKFWMGDIKEAIGGRGVTMIPETALKLDTVSTIVELYIPMYLFQYKKNEETYTVCVPPLKVPNSMKKPDKDMFFGDHKTVCFYRVVPDIEKSLIPWLEKQANTLDIASNIQDLDNILNDPTSIRNNFFNSNKLFLDTLKVNKGKLESANQRLTTKFSG